VHDEVVAVRGQQTRAHQVVVDGLVDRHDLGLADVDTHDGTDAGPPRARDSGCAGRGAGIVEAHPIDDGPIRDQPEQPRTWIARLRTRRDRADLDVAETERAEPRDTTRLLVETRGESERCRELEPEGAHR